MTAAQPPRNDPSPSLTTNGPSTITYLSWEAYQETQPKTQQSTRLAESQQWKVPAANPNSTEPKNCTKHSIDRDFSKRKFIYKTWLQRKCTSCARCRPWSSSTPKAESGSICPRSITRRRRLMWNRASIRLGGSLYPQEVDPEIFWFTTTII